MSKKAPRKASYVNINIRTTPRIRRMLMAAAEADGLKLAAWLRSLGLKSAARAGFKQEDFSDE